MAETENSTSGSGTNPAQGGQDHQKESELIKKVSERVWQLLQQDLRRDQERRGKRFGSR